MFGRLPHWPRVTTAVIALMLALVPMATAGGYAHRSISPSGRSWIAATCHHHQVCAGSSVSKTVAVVVSAARFQWSSAAIGFGVACGMALLTTGVFLVRRRTRFIDAGTPRVS